MLVRDIMGTNEGKQLKYFQLMEDLKAKILTGKLHSRNTHVNRLKKENGRGDFIAEEKMRGNCNCMCTVAFSGRLS